MISDGLSPGRLWVSPEPAGIGSPGHGAASQTSLPHSPPPLPKPGHANPVLVLGVFLGWLVFAQTLLLPSGLFVENCLLWSFPSLCKGTALY